MRRRVIRMGHRIPGQHPDEPLRIGECDIGNPGVNGGRQGRRNLRVDR